MATSSGHIMCAKQPSDCFSADLAGSQPIFRCATVTLADVCCSERSFEMRGWGHEEESHPYGYAPDDAYNGPQDLDHRLRWIRCLNGKCIQETNDGEQA
jgi:hypothetical protein